MFFVFVAGSVLVRLCRLEEGKEVEEKQLDSNPNPNPDSKHSARSTNLAKTEEDETQSNSQPQLNSKANPHPSLSTPSSSSSSSSSSTLVLLYSSAARVQAMYKDGGALLVRVLDVTGGWSSIRHIPQLKSIGLVPVATSVCASSSSSSASALASSSADKEVFEFNLENELFQTRPASFPESKHSWSVPTAAYPHLKLSDGRAALETDEKDEEASNNPPPSHPQISSSKLFKSWNRSSIVRDSASVTRDKTTKKEPDKVAGFGVGFSKVIR
ncbi:hypothetical protein EV361DRAFT_964886 [Lentinula raphanica]|nr:hypothetical protein EV361DRAFT_964886 [Lentinula raphanica]